MGFDRKINYVQRALESVINVLVGATAVFYHLEDLVKPSKLSRELFINLITNYIFEGEVYFLLFNLTSSWMETPLLKLQRIMNNLTILENELPISGLNISPEMQFDVNQRTKYPRKDEGEELQREEGAEPYMLVRQRLKKLIRLESPMSKLEWIYSCCTKSIPEEVSAFWSGYDIPSKRLMIDTDQL